MTVNSHCLELSSSDDDGDLEDQNEDEEEDDVDQSRPTRKQRKLVSDQALRWSLSSGLYPQFLGHEGPTDTFDPNSTAFDFLRILWPSS